MKLLCIFAWLVIMLSRVSAWLMDWVIDFGDHLSTVPDGTIFVEEAITRLDQNDNAAQKRVQSFL